MRIGRTVRATVAAIAASCVLVQTSAQAPEVRLVGATVLVGRTSHPQRLHLTLDVSAPFVVAKLELFWADRSRVFHKVELRREVSLQYSARLPYADRISYYIELTSERGERTAIGSRISPFNVFADQLPRALDEEPRRSWLRSVLRFSLASLAAIVSIGLVKAKKVP